MHEPSSSDLWIGFPEFGMSLVNRSVEIEVSSHVDLMTRFPQFWGAVSCFGPLQLRLPEFQGLIGEPPPPHPMHLDGESAAPMGALDLGYANSVATSENPPQKGSFPVGVP